MTYLGKFSTNSYDMNDLASCGLKWSLNHGLFSITTMHQQHHGDIPGSDFDVFGRYAHVMSRMFFEENFKTPGSFAGRGIGLWVIYLDRVDMYERHPKGVVAGYTPRIRPMWEEFYEVNQGERRNGTIGFEVRGKTYANTGKYLVGLGGRIDRLWTRNGREVATDYKTTSRRSTESKLRQDPQFIIHSLIRKQSTGKFPEIEVYYPGFPSGGRHLPTETVSFQMTEADIKNFLEKLNEAGDKGLRLLEEIRGGKRITPEYTDRCFLCKYAVTGFCDEYTGGNMNSRYKSPLRIAPRKIPGRKMNRKYRGLLKLRNWPKKFYITVPRVIRNDQYLLFMDM